MKTVVLTGGTGLIGKELTKYLLMEGFRVIISSRNANKNDFLIKNKLQEHKGNFEIFELNYFKDGSVKNFVELLMQSEIYPDAIVHNARSLETLEVQKDGQSSKENLLREYEMGVVGPYELNYAILDSKIGNKLSNIIIVSSMYGVVAPTPQLYENFRQQSPIQYGIAKAAQIHLTKELAVRFAENSIRVNAVSFGGVEGKVGEKFKDRYSKLAPLNKMLSIEEVVKPIIFLLSDGANGMTGHNLIVDGGWTIW